MFEAAPLGGRVQMMDAPALPPSSITDRSPQAHSPVQHHSDVETEEEEEASTALSEGPKCLPAENDVDEEPEENVEEDHQQQIDIAHETENIGSFCDADVPLIYCARRLVLSFLLSGTKGELAPDSRSRVSAKVLAFGCLTAVVRLSPKVFLLTLAVDADEEDASTPLIRDVTNYDSHHDPQLRGCAAVLLGAVVKGAVVEGGGDLVRDQSGKLQLFVAELLQALVHAER